MSDEFDLLGPLPTGTTVLEASAGTGKTFTIAGLVTRYVAEGHVRIDELLVMTFGRLATQELRDRVRGQLVATRDALRDPVAARAGGDRLSAFLADVPDDEVARRAQRLAVALASFDSATVVTMHEFCQQVLTGLGTAGDVDPNVVLVETLDDLVDEVTDDLYLRKWGTAGSGMPSLSLADARELARVAVADGQAHLLPGGDAAGHAGERARFAATVRAEVDRRKRRRRVVGFDDLLTRLRDTLTDPQTGPAATTRLRARYRVVLVDEFQDTDPVQWDIVRLAFHTASSLVLIGDPKQAIYAFRGADVHAYLGAVDVADRRATLARNWRSDPDLLRGLDALFRGAALGDPRIAVAAVTSAHDGRSLDVSGAPVRLRLVPRDETGAVDPLRGIVVRDLVNEIVDLLDSGAVLRPRDAAPRPLRPGDLAVLAATNRQLEAVHRALLAAGVPSVLRTTSSVFGTSAAADWVVLLEALEQPHRSGRLRRLAVTPFVGWDAVRLEGADDGAASGDDVDALGLALRHWLRTYDRRGIAALFETVAREQALAARLLGEQDGERRLTDLRHVAEALHAAALADGLGLTATLEWLRHRIDDAQRDSTGERSRRLDSDAAAVQLVTVHRSKGLEFPVVYVPFGWDRFVRREPFPLFHDAAAESRRTRDVGGESAPGFVEHQRQAEREAYGEDLRLLYVALTRAQAQVTAWWAPSNKNTHHAPLHRLLFAPDPATEVPDGVPVPRDTVARTKAGALARPDALDVQPVTDRPAPRWERPGERTTELAVARLGRAVDTAWRRTSYTALTAASHDRTPALLSEPEPEDEAREDEPDTTPDSDPALTGAPADGRDVPAPMSGPAGGAAFGTLVHAVLERVDPTAPDLAAEVRAHVVTQAARLGPSGPGSPAADPGPLTDALLTSLATPLGPLAGGRPLAAIAPADRLAELDFELPLAGGDRPTTAGLTARHLVDLAAVLRDHLPADDPLAPYADELADPALAPLALTGYLTGSIDAVLRIADGWGPRFVVVDYKTNRLAPVDEHLTAWHYRPDALASAMRQAHYPLQALLYEVALHRFLRWRLADYDPTVHLGGVLYLFLRGMCGPDVVLAGGAVPGVFAWQPPPALVLAASDVLAGRP